jgi:hypothetical protein
MLKKLMLSAAVSTLMVSGALAQANQPPAAASGPNFVASQSAEQWVFSKFKGTDVLGSDNAHIGDVSDMLFDKNGKVIALIVGVGGFLGIGEKSVAIDMSAFKVVPANTGATTGAGGTGGGAATADNDPTNVKLQVSWTKEQLKAAPDFQYYKPPARQSAPTTGMTPRTGTGSPAPQR